MTNESIHPSTGLGPVALRVRDLDRSVDFYTNNIGLTLTAMESPEARLGAGDVHLLTLREDANARIMRGTAGLYHFAILVPSRIELARSLKHLADSNTPLQGFADHLVSEAIYLADPDGNGIEIYRDRPRDQWPRENGQLLMATDPLDINSLLDEISGPSEPWTGLAAGTTIGHVHLQVSDLGKATHFYREILGFELILRYGPSAAFLSAGGYHHHVGLNTWAGRGIPPAPDNATGLIHFTIELPDQESYQSMAHRLGSQSLAVDQRAQSLKLHDPSGIGILLRARA